MLKKVRLSFILMLFFLTLFTQITTRPNSLVRGESKSTVTNDGNALILSQGATPSGIPVAIAKEEPGQPSAGAANVFPDRPAVIQYEQVKLEIPAEAVRQPATIIIERLQQVAGLNPGMDNATGEGGGYRFKPDGMVFLKPIKVTIPYDRATIHSDEDLANLHTYFYNVREKCWEQLQRVGIDPKNGTVTSLTTHFTDMINGILSLPSAPRPLSFNPNSIKDIKAADPGAGINLINPPQANSQGTANLSYPIEVPPGRGGMHPQLAVVYNSDSDNGWMGLGWDLPQQAVTLDTRWGVPRYSAIYETETYLLDGAQLAPVAHRGDLVARTANKTFTHRVEGGFLKIQRLGSSPKEYRWEVTDKQGTRYFYGGTPENGLIKEAVLVTDEGNIFRWALVQVRDTRGNTINYSYQKVSDSGTGSVVPGTQLYLAQIQYTGTA
ncbi:MAG TPA: SpvB/TcaC N-terminal domain-containing protein, partial [Bacillota bacterium]|nr:SpvB/TcaC N-terminal domain-containing protein [Bacillota bacterium]